MSYCNNCGYPLKEGTKFCTQCGTPVDNKAYKRDEVPSFSDKRKPLRKPNLWQRLTERINEYIGNNHPADLNWRVLFTDVLKKHSTAEAESIFISGTKYTTPALDQVSKDWPRPWLYSRVSLLFVLAFMLLWMCVNIFGNTNALPGMIVAGSFTVPLATMVLFMELNVWRNISMYVVIKTFLVGGCTSLLTTLFLFQLFSVEDMDFAGAFLVGLIEEMGKAIIVYLFIKKVYKRSILSGLLIGASIGAGFAAFESAGYAMQPMITFLQYAGYAQAYGQSVNYGEMLDAINQSVILRGFLAPGGHVAWAAISGAALIIASKSEKQYTMELLMNHKFLRLFAIPVVLHGLWDSPLTTWCFAIFPFSGHFALIVLVWVVVLILVNMGLAEVSQGSKV